MTDFCLSCSLMNQRYLRMYGQILLIDGLSHYLEGFVHPRWCRISSINSMTKEVLNFIIRVNFNSSREIFFLTIIFQWIQRCRHWLGGGFKHFFIFTPSWWRFPIWRSYFSNGLNHNHQLLGKVRQPGPVCISGWAAPHCDDSPFKRGVEGMMDDWSGQIIATSHDLTPNGWLE